MAQKRRTPSRRRRTSSKRGSQKRGVTEAANTILLAKGDSKDRVKQTDERGRTLAADRRHRRAKRANADSNEARRRETGLASEPAETLTKAIVATGTQALRMAAAVARNMAKGVRGGVEDRDPPG
jgi:hypothetical protein